MRDQVLALQIPERVLQLHQLNEEVVLRVYLGCMHRALEIEREPLLYARHPGALGEIEEQYRVEHDRRSENAVAAQEIDLELHRIAQPPNQIDVVPAFFVVTA